MHAPHALSANFTRERVRNENRHKAPRCEDTEEREAVTPPTPASNKTFRSETVASSAVERDRSTRDTAPLIKPSLLDTGK